MSHREASSRWPIGSWSGARSPGNAPRAGSRSNSSTSTGAPVIPSNVARPTNSSDARVWSTRTAWPALVARRTNSTALYAEMPPLTPSRMRAISRPRPPASDAVARVDLALSDFLEGDRQVVLGGRLHHRRGKLLENSLTERVVVVVDLARPLRCHDDRRIVRVHVVEQAVDARINQRDGSSILAIGLGQL